MSAVREDRLAVIIRNALNQGGRRPLANLPNKTGFKFIGVKESGERIPCVVKLNPVGCHGVYDDQGAPCWFQLSGWMPI